jgi:NAD(P)-dependent dehydrogenase (short-subunit alcohol dehydrogenase family)
LIFTPGAAVSPPNPVDIADVVVFLASHESSFMTAAVVPVEAGDSAW